MPDTLSALRQAARAARPRQEGMRRVYLLPERQVRAVLEYQIAEGLSSEVAAVRRLLGDALDAWERRRDGGGDHA